MGERNRDVQPQIKQRDEELVSHEIAYVARVVTNEVLMKDEKNRAKKPRVF